MKRSVVVLIMFLTLGGGFVQAQELDIFNQNEFVWLGLDFTGAKMIGSDFFKDPKLVKDEMFDRWNNLMLDEADKYNVPDFFQIRTRYNDVLPAKKRNGFVNVEGLVIDESGYELSKEKVAAICSAYKGNTQNNQGLGILFVIESFDKTTDLGHIYVVLMDLKTARPQYVKKYSSPAGGAGMRNFWARSILETMISAGAEYRDNKARYQKLKRM